MNPGDRYDTGAALYITSRNCDAVLGLPWETALAIAQRNGVAILTVGPRRRVIAAHEIARALQAEHERHRPEQPHTEQQRVDAILQSWGLERRPGVTL